MAKIRRIIRRVSSAENGFDEQLWPVYLAIVLLGGYLVGFTLVYLRFDDPRWWANAFTHLVMVVLMVGLVLAAIPWISNRFLKRSMQLALIVSLMLHAFALPFFIQMVIFYDVFPVAVKEKDLVEPEKIVRLPDFRPFQEDQRKREKRDFEKPVETVTPDVEPQEVVEKTEIQPEERDEPKKEITPVPETELTEHPSQTPEKQVAETAPRYAESDSKLSKQTTKQTLKPATQVASVELPKVDKPDKPNVKPTEEVVQRQDVERPTQRQESTQQPQTTEQTSEVKIARRVTENTPQQESSQQPTLEKQVAQPKQIPKTNVEQIDVPTVAKETPKDNVRPDRVATAKVTPSPSIDKVAVTVPTTETSNPEANAARKTPSPDTPEIAKPDIAKVSPSPTPTRKPLPTPQITEVADAAVPSAQPTQNAPQLTESTQAPVQKADASKPIERVVEAADVPTTSPAVTPSQQPTKSTSEAQPVIADTSPTPIRRTPSSRIATQTTAEPVEIVQTQPAPQTQPQAAKVAVSKPTTAPESATRPVQNSPAQTPAATPSEAPSQVAQRKPVGETAPQITQAPVSVPNKVAATSAVAPSTTVANVEAPQSPVTSTEPQPRETLAKVSQQSEPSESTNVQRPAPATEPTTSPTTQIAASPAARRTDSQAPSPTVTSNPADTPRRTPLASQIASSPTNVSSPSAAEASQATSNPTAQPSKIAIDKSISGVAGAGRSTNMDRAAPAQPTQSLVASGALARAKSTTADAGPALAASDQALIRKSVAGKPTPSATAQAADVAVPDIAGSNAPAELAASSSASLTQKSSNAESGEVTASKGNVSVDLGPTQVVSENATGRASGGGQPKLNTETDQPKLARSEVGGSPMASVDTTVNNNDIASATPVQAGSGPQATELSPAQVAASRTEKGDVSPTTAGPSSASATGPTELASLAEEIAQASLSKAAAAEAASGQPKIGGGEMTDEEEEKKKRLARAASGGVPTIDTVAAIPGSVAAPNSGNAPAVDVPAGAAPQEVAVTRQDATGTTKSSPSEAATQGPASSATAETVAEVQPSAAPKRSTGGGSPAPTLAGGSNATPGKASPTGGIALAMAEPIEIPGSPGSSGQPSGASEATEGLTAQKVAAGKAGPTSNAETGAAKGEAEIESPSEIAIGGRSGRKASSSNADGPELVADASGLPISKSDANQLPIGSLAAAEIDVPVGPTPTSLSGPSVDALAGDDVGPMGKTQATDDGGFAIEVDANNGPGGLGPELAADVGIANRRASHESAVIQPLSVRYPRQDVGGLPSINAVAVVAKEGFRGRKPLDTGGPMDDGTSGRGRPSPETEESIELGLVFLAKHQSADGRWSLHNFAAGRPGYETEETPALTSDTAATGLALLAFQGAGYHHKEFKYKDVVRRGVEHLLKDQKEDGDLYKGLEDAHAAVRLYSHAVAALALTEAYGMTQDPELRGPAQKALDFIVASQHPERGGWRYAPQVSSDTSVTGWMMMALKSGQLAGLEVPDKTYQKIDHWLDLSKDSTAKPYLYRYNPLAPDTKEQRHGRVASDTMTSVGLLMRLYSGWSREDGRMQQGADYLGEHLPSIGTTRDPKRDTYYWYYATQVMFHMGDDHWKRWEDSLYPLLRESQIKTGPKAGSWDPLYPVPDRWGPHAGRIYVTTMNLLSMEVYYRHLPLYVETKK